MWDYEVLKLSKPDRLRLLLRSLDRVQWKCTPPRVGLKTALDARQRGYIELLIEPQKRYLCRLTAAGYRLRLRLIALERAQEIIRTRMSKDSEQDKKAKPVSESKNNDFLYEASLKAFLVTATILVDAEDEMTASREAMKKLLIEPQIAFDVQSDSEQHVRVVIYGSERDQLIAMATLSQQPKVNGNDDHRQ